MLELEHWSQIESLAREGRISYIFCDLFDTLLIRPTVTYDAFIFSRQNFSKRLLRFFEKIVRAFLFRFSKHDITKNFVGRQIVRLVQNDQIDDFADLVFRRDLLEKLVRLQSLKIQIFIVSNTEIADDLIALKLRGSGLNDPQICTSRNYHLLKSQGLYQDILREFQIPATSVVVIGDDLKEDLRSAEKSGIRNFHIQSVKNLIEQVISEKQVKILAGDEKGSVLLCNLVKWINDTEEIGLWEIVGFFYSAMLSNFIAKSIFETITPTQNKEVIFLSREGFLPHYSFKSRYQDTFAAHYLYVSRTLLRKAEGLEFIRSQLTFNGDSHRKYAIFDVGWRGRSVSQVRDLLSVSGNNFFLALWPWRKGPTDSIMLFVPRWNLRRILILRKCPEILEFILAAPHKTMASTKVVDQADDSAEAAICNGFFKSGKYSTPDLSRDLIFEIFSELLANPTSKQAHFFGGVKHSVSGEAERSLLDKDPILWLQGARAAKSVDNYDIFREYVRRLVSFVKQ